MPYGGPRRRRSTPSPSSHGKAGIRRVNRATRSYPDTPASVATPRQAATKFVDKHVSRDFSHLLPSAIQGIAEAEQSVNPSKKLFPSTLGAIAKSAKETAPQLRASQRETARTRRTTKAQQYGPRLSEAAPAAQQRAVKEQRKESSDDLKRMYEAAPEGERQVLKKQVHLERARQNLDAQVKAGNTNPVKQQRNVARRKRELEAEYNKQADLGNIVHPNMPRDFTALVGDLIPDTPGEFAATVGTAGVGTALSGAVRGGARGIQAVRAARRGEEVAGTARKGYTGLPVISGGSREALGRAGEKAGAAAAQGFQNVRRFSQSKAGRSLRVGAFAGGVGAAQATGNLVPNLKGGVEALKHPRETGQATARGAIGLVTGPLTVGANLAMTGRRLLTLARDRGEQGSLKHALEPTVRTSQEFWDQAKREFEVFTSKDPKAIAKAVENDYGLWPYLGAAYLSRAFLGEAVKPAYLKGRGAAREAVRARRHGQTGYPIPETEAGPIFPKLEGAKQSIRLARQRAREESRKAGIEHRAAAPVARRARRIVANREGQEIAHRLEEWSKRKQSEIKSPVKIAPADLAPFMATSRITNESRGAALKELDQIEAHLDHIGAPEDAFARLEIEALREAPELLTRPEKRGPGRGKGVQAFWDMVDEYRKQSPDVPGLERSQIARRMTVAAAADIHGGERILRPEQEIPVGARAYTEARSREEAVGSNAESYRKSELAQERKELRAELRKKEPDPDKVADLRQRIQAKRETMGPVKLSRAEREGALREAGLQVFPTKKVRTADGGTTKAWSRQQVGVMRAAQQAKRAARDEGVLEPLTREFMHLTDEEIGRRGLEEPAFVAQRGPDEGLDTGIGIERPGTTKDKFRTGERQRKGEIVESYADLPRTIQGAARRDAQQRYLGWFTDEYHFVTDLGEGKQNVFTDKQLTRVKKSGELGPDPKRDYVEVPINFLDDEKTRDAIFGAENPRNAWELEVQKAEAEGRGTRKMVFPRRAWDNFLAQQSALSKYQRWLSNAMTVQSRALLATSFGWMISQPIAEAIPLLMHDPNPARMIRATKYVLDARKDPRRARDLAFAADTTPGGDPATRSAQGYQQQVHRSIQAVGHSPAGYVFRQAAKGEYIIGFDRAKGALLREIGYVMELDKEVNSRVRHLVKAVGGIYDEIDKASGVLRHMDTDEQINWLVNTKAGRAASERLQNNLDDAMGNWTALTPAERMVSQAVIFYPFLRFSLDWTFRTFPKRHPIRFAIAGQMGQWNSEILEKFLTHKPAFFSGWATIPLFGEAQGPPTGVINAARFTPGGNVAVEAAGDAENFGDLSKAFAPYLKIPIDLFGRRDIFGNEVEGGFGADVKNLGEHLGGLPFPVREYLRNQSNDSPGRQGAWEHALRAQLPFLTEDFKDAKLRATVAELYDRRNVESTKAMAPYSEGIDTKKYGEWYEEDNADLVRTFKNRGFSEKEAEDKAKVRTGKDVGRYLNAFVRDNNPHREEYKQYLQEKAIRTTAQEKVDKYNRRLVKLYGNAGVPLTPSLESAYSNDIDTGRSGPRYQHEVGMEKAAATVAPGAPFKIKQEVEATTPGKNVVPAAKRLAGVKAGVKPVSIGQAAENGAKNIKKGGVEIPGPEGVFVNTLARKTGLDPGVVAAWTQQEGGNGQGNWNVLNIGTGFDDSINSQFTNPKRAATLTAQFLKGKRFGASEGIRNILPQARGKSPEQQLQAIAGSGWATDPQYAQKLAAVYNSQGWSGGGATSVKFSGKAPPALRQSFKQAVRLADKLDKAGIPYDWGGGHVEGRIPGPGQGGTYDCSGAVSWLLQRMGVKLPRALVSGELASTEYLKPGEGAVTVFANGEHTFMKIGDRYWGTSGSYRDQSGPGWFEGTPSKSYLSGFAARHVPGFGAKAARQLGAKLVGGMSGGGSGVSIGGGGGGTASGGSSGGGGGGGGGSSSFSPMDLSKLSAISEIAGGGSTLPEVPSVLTTLPKIPALPTPRKRKRLPIGAP